MRTIKSVMTTSVISVTPNSKIRDAIQLMLKHNISGLPVIDENDQLQGIISEYDLLGLLYGAKLTEIDVAAYMSKDVIAIEQDEDIGQVVDLFLAKGIRRIPVVQNGRLTGIVSRRDLIRRILEHNEGPFAPENELSAHSS